MLVAPSPKSHAHVVTDPVVVLEKATPNGAGPLVTLALKSTTGTAGVLLTVIAEEAVLVTVPPGPVAVSATE